MCPRCETSWFVAPDAKSIADGSRETENAVSAVPEITVEAISERTHQPSYEELYGSPAALPASPPHPQIRLPRMPPAVIAISLCLAAAMGVIGFRGQITRLWPQSAKIYAAAGLKTNPRGLDLRHLHVNLVHDGAHALLVVDGEIANSRDAKTPVPKIKLAVRDAKGQEIYSWDEASPKAKLDSGETIAFRARLVAPPTAGRDVFVRFAAAEPAQPR